jgi:hypothetical protein
MDSDCRSFVAVQQEGKMSKVNVALSKDYDTGYGGPNESFLFKNGTPVAILRPKDPERKLAGVAKIKDGTPHGIADRMFNELLGEQPHLFVGYAGRGGEILDAHGKPIDTLKPGDSFVGCGDGSGLAPPAFMRKTRV